jgi:signal transduction histidine kinase
MTADPKTASSDSETALREKKRVLAALVVHDLRSPLSAVQGYLHLLREEVGDDASHVVKQYILDVDELEDGILRAVKSPVKLVELIDRARAGNRAHFEVRQLRVDVDVDPEMTIQIDRDLFSRVIENMLDNAARYAPRGGRCSVAVKRDAQGIEIAIGNSGPPVPPAERDRIFGRYFQVERRRASARANRGLGLYFCKLAAEAHGGTIHVEERGDLGAVFVVRLPPE